MRNPVRIDSILEDLRRYWHANPDLRLGQIVENAAKAIDPPLDVFYMEDGEFSAGLDMMSGKLNNGGN